TATQGTRGRRVSTSRDRRSHASGLRPLPGHQPPDRKQSFVQRRKRLPHDTQRQPLAASRGLWILAATTRTRCARSSSRIGHAPRLRRQKRAPPKPGIGWPAATVCEKSFGAQRPRSKANKAVTTLSFPRVRAPLGGLFLGNRFSLSALSYGVGVQQWQLSALL